MKRVIIVTAILLLMSFARVAMADSVQGTWSGSAKAMGHSFRASCTFNGSGGFTARAAGISVSGGYSISGSSVTLSAKGTSITFKITTSGNRQSMSGSGRYRGVKGSIYLSRTVSDSQLAVNRTSPFARWRSETDDHSGVLELYESGFVYYSVLNASQSREEAFQSVKSGLESGEITDYFSLISAMDESAAPDEHIGTAEFDDGVATVTLINGKCPAWKEFEKDGKYVIGYKVESGKLAFAGTKFDYDSLVGTKPENALFRPYITLERGDDGEAVKSIQQKLIELKFLEGKADGSFGPMTESAVIAFERDKGLNGDGKLSGGEIAEVYASGEAK